MQDSRKAMDSAARSTCENFRPPAVVIRSASPQASPSPNCVDNDLDGVCSTSDCNDSVAWASFDIDGDSFCEDVDCVDTNPQIYPGAPLDPETTGLEDRNCNGQDDYDEQGLGPCGWLREQQCRAAGKDWDAGHCQCNFFSDPSPILVDILGNGFQLTTYEDGVFFDLNNDGTREKLSWTRSMSDEAWLALDINGNGLIDQGSELFGNFSPQPTPPVGHERNGFLALAEHDKPAKGGNADGVISVSDAIFTRLWLWQDRNHNGMSEAIEIFSVSTMGVTTIELNYKLSKKTDDYGNQFRYRAKIRDSHGAQISRWAWDVFLVNVSR